MFTVQSETIDHENTSSSLNDIDCNGFSSEQIETADLLGNKN